MSPSRCRRPSMARASIPRCRRSLADELGADWRTVAVEPAPLNPLYANPLAADELFEGVFDALPGAFRATRMPRAPR